MSKIRLDTYLFENGYYESRARAASAIRAGKVEVNGQIARKPASKVPADAVINAAIEHPWVSRGGMKLAYAIAQFKAHIKDKICLDVGASTGGFTDVLLSHGAARIYAVDVGRDQLHEKLRNDNRVVVMESTDARGLVAKNFSDLPELIVCDASFISAAKVLERPMSLVGKGAILLTLFKPQFEVGPENIGRGGLVKDIEIARSFFEQFQNWVATIGWIVESTDISPITGGDGNTEFLLFARKK